MNIIKFTDTVVTGRDWYNSNIRGKYTYWVHCRYVISFDDIDEGIYYELENENNEFIVSYCEENSINYIDTNNSEWINGYIDHSITESINSIEQYKHSNSFVPDNNITIDELKKFRTWLATNLLNIKIDLSDTDIHILEYYSNGMTDDTLKWLNEFGTIDIKYNNIIQNNCGCGSGATNTSGLYNTSVSVCDPILIYMNNIKAGMVNMFSNIDFWKILNPDFLDEIIKYLNGILKANLPLVYLNSTLDIYSCKCLNDRDLASSQARGLLGDLIKAFELIKNNDIVGHKNNIFNTLHNWSLNLYEIMEWN